MTDDEILNHYGCTIWSALAAFGSDPEFFTDMVRAADAYAHRRDMSREAALRNYAERRPGEDSQECR